jgi:hypothetical protein
MSKKKHSGKGKNTRNQPIVANPALRGRDKAKLNRYQKEELVTKIIGWICDGFTDKDEEEGTVDKIKLKRLVIRNAPVELTDNDATELIRFAFERLGEITMQDAPVVISVHIENYERIYEYFKRIGHTQGVNKALKAKEALLGVLGKKSVTINQKKKTVINRVVEYDWSRLTPSEQLEMEEIINKAK